MSTTTERLVRCHCAECGCAFGLTAFYDEQRREDGQGFYCPNGHSLTFGETALDKERRRAGHLAARLAQEEATRRETERSLIAQKGATTRAKKRAAAGVCPCCNRTFKQLPRHMQSKHPDFDPESATA